MRKAFVAIALFFASSHCLADDFNIEDPSLSDPPPTVQSAIRADSSYVGYERCVLIGRQIRLSATPNAQYFAATTSNGCNWGAALGPIWLVSFNSRRGKVVLAFGGASVTVGAHSHHGLRDLAISTGTAGLYEERLWQFNGTKYIKKREYVGPPR